MANDNSESFAVGGTYRYGAFVTVLVTNIIITIVIFLVFSILRALRQNRYFFAPQYYDQLGTTDPLPDPGTGLFSWIHPVINFDDRDFFEMRVVELRAKLIDFPLILQIFAPIGLAILLPLDATGGFLPDNNGVPGLSMANVSNHSGRLWVHALYAVFCTFITFYMLYKLYETYTRWRIQWLRRETARNYTVMYKGIPRELLSQYTPMQIFSRYFPGKIVDAQIGLQAGRLRKLVKKYKNNQQKLEFAQAALAEHGTHSTKRTKPLIGQKIDSIEYYEQQLAALGAQIEAERNTVGFVTFNSIRQASHREQYIMDEKADIMTPEHAPDPSDVYWGQLEYSKNYRIGMTPVAWAICAGLIIFWGAITVFIQGLANLKNLAKTNGFHWLNSVINWNAVAYGLITGYLPALILIILFSLLPTILAVIVKLKGVYTYSQVQRSVLKYYYWFLVANVFLISLVSGTVIQILHQFVNNSGFNVLTTLGEALPAQSSFFINYILTYALTSYPTNILRIGSFVTSMLKKRMAKSTAEIQSIERPKGYSYDTYCGVQLLIFIIGFTYTPIAPFIIPWAIIYFGFAYLYGKYQLMYVYNPDYDSGALFWPVMFNRVIFGMLLAQITLIGLFIFKHHPSLVFVVPLPFFTIAFVYLVHQRFDGPSTHLPVHECPLDRPNNGTLYQGVYQDPFTALDISEGIRHKPAHAPVPSAAPPVGPGAV